MGRDNGTKGHNVARLFVWQFISTLDNYYSIEIYLVKTICLYTSRCPAALLSILLVPVPMGISENSFSANSYTA